MVLDANTASQFGAAVEKAKENSSVVLIDMPLVRERRSQFDSAYLACTLADIVLFSTGTRPLDSVDATETLEMLREVSSQNNVAPLIGWVPPMIISKSRLFKSLGDWGTNLGGQVLPHIGQHTVIAEAMSSGQTIAEYAPSTVAGDEFRRLAEAVNEICVGMSIAFIEKYRPRQVEKHLSGDSGQRPLCEGTYSSSWTNCIGTRTWRNGRKYIGEWTNGKRHGHGTNTLSDGAEYIGEWEDDKPSGHGTYTWPDGEKYVGENKNGKSHGQGTKTFPDGQEYIGEWKDGRVNGQGTLTLPGGMKYFGEWTNDKLHLPGTCTWPDGQKYVGEFKNGKRHGRGTGTSPDGNKYIGEWKNDSPNGRGIHISPDGQRYVGEFKNGKRYELGSTTPSGDSKKMIVKMAGGDIGSLGLELGKICLLHDLTVVMVAKIFEVSRMTVYNWFSGASVPSKHLHRRIRLFMENLNKSKQI